MHHQTLPRLLIDIMEPRLLDEAKARQVEIEFTRAEEEAITRAVERFLQGPGRADMDVYEIAWAIEVYLDGEAKAFTHFEDFHEVTDEEINSEECEEHFDRVERLNRQLVWDLEALADFMPRLSTILNYVDPAQLDLFGDLSEDDTAVEAVGDYSIIDAYVSATVNAAQSLARAGGVDVIAFSPNDTRADVHALASHTRRHASTYRGLMDAGVTAGEIAEVIRLEMEGNPAGVNMVAALIDPREMSARLSDLRGCLQHWEQLSVLYVRREIAMKEKSAA